ALLRGFRRRRSCRGHRERESRDRCNQYTEEPNPASRQVPHDSFVLRSNLLRHFENRNERVRFTVHPPPPESVERVAPFATGSIVEVRAKQFRRAPTARANLPAVSSSGP